MKLSISGGLRPLVRLSMLMLWGVGGLAASALELGAGRLMSASGAPLDVEIPLLQVGEGELDTLKPQLPANSRSAELADATVELSKASDGAAMLRVRSSAPLAADSVRFVVVADWGRGRRFREYTFSLRSSLTSGVEAPLAAPASAEPPPPAAVTTLSTAGGLAVDTVPTRGAAPDAERVSRVVLSGETLMSISREWSAKTGATLAQTMLGIYRANPRSFGPGGMSELLVNARLSLPASEDLRATSASAASSEIARELQIWRTGGPAPAPSAPALLKPALPAPALSKPPEVQAPVFASPSVVVETPEIKVSMLETALTEKSAALAAADAEAAALRTRIAALEASASMAKEKNHVGWLAKAREWAALAWWVIPALALLVLVLVVTLLMKGRNKAVAGAAVPAETSTESAHDPNPTSTPREMSFELPPIKPNRAETLVTRAPAAPAAYDPALASDLEGDPPPIDEAGSKINLARAFIEMGHHDAAILELQAALRIGAETQRAEAIRLLDSLPKS